MLLVLLSVLLEVEVLLDVEDELLVDVEVELLLVVEVLLLVLVLVLLDVVMLVVVCVVVMQQSDAMHPPGVSHVVVGNGFMRNVLALQSFWLYFGNAHDPSCAQTYGLYCIVCSGRYVAPFRCRPGDMSVSG